MTDIAMKVKRKSDAYLAHHGVKGMRWGVRKDRNKTVFISGSSKTQDQSSIYYRKNLSKDITDTIDSYIENQNTILVGDAPGIDRQVQDYLKKKKYKNVEVYGPGNKSVRYIADKTWKTNLVDNPRAEEGSSKWLAAKDIAMSNRADSGLGIILEDGAGATRNNLKRLINDNKEVKLYQLTKDGNDSYIDDAKEIINKLFKEKI